MYLESSSLKPQASTVKPHTALQSLDRDHDPTACFCFLVLHDVVAA